MAVKKKSSGGGGANWMDTYGDMVTLLLCFFVLLYSMSTISQDKWKAIVQSFNPSAVLDAQETSGNDGPIAGDDNLGTGELQLGPEEMTPQDVEDALQMLFQSLKSYAEESQMEDVIEITKGDGYVFVSFADAVFFDGDSPVLRRDGKEILDVVIGALEPAVPAIDELRVMGHTAQARADAPNPVEGDRRLASNRATNVLIYIQENCSIEPARLLSIGYGQWRPVDSNADGAHRAHNRRVELLITGKDIESKLGDALEQYTSIRAGEASLITGSEAADAGGLNNADAAMNAVVPPQP
ncbi:MAG: flagellar motor protein MotB [Oscillospiraceae bacterium]|nr:flagellar motor protein MotB [Oscillospiraceae bacterium]